MAHMAQPFWSLYVWKNRSNALYIKKNSCKTILSRVKAMITNAIATNKKGVVITSRKHLMHVIHAFSLL